MDDRIKAKLQKLLALAANNPSPEEAAAAFARAQEMATRHRIELASIEIGAEPMHMVQEDVQERGKRVAGWKKVLIGGTCRASGVFVVFTQGAALFTLAGRSDDVQTARYMYAAICAEIERLARAQASGLGRAFVNAFKLGAASVVAERLLEQSAATIQDARASGTSETALVRVESSCDDAKRWYTSETGAKLRRGRVSSSSTAGRQAGRAAGQNINIGNNTAMNRGARAAIS